MNARCVKRTAGGAVPMSHLAGLIRYDSIKQACACGWLGVDDTVNGSTCRGFEDVKRLRLEALPCADDRILRACLVDAVALPCIGNPRSPVVVCVLRHGV